MSHLSVHSLKLSIWSHGKNLSKQHTHGQTYRLFYADQLGPSFAPLILLEDLLGGETDPIVLPLREITSIKVRVAFPS